MSARLQTDNLGKVHQMSSDTAKEYFSPGKSYDFQIGSALITVSRPDAATDHKQSTIEINVSGPKSPERTQVVYQIAERMLEQYNVNFESRISGNTITLLTRHANDRDMTFDVDATQGMHVLCHGLQERSQQFQSFTAMQRNNDRIVQGERDKQNAASQAERLQREQEADNGLRDAIAQGMRKAGAHDELIHRLADSVFDSVKQHLGKGSGVSA